MTDEQPKRVLVQIDAPVELYRAHQANAKAVMKAYGFWGSVKAESDCVAWQMEMCAKMTKYRMRIVHSFGRLL